MVIDAEETGNNNNNNKRKCKQRKKNLTPKKSKNDDDDDLKLSVIIQLNLNQMTFKCIVLVKKKTNEQEKKW